MGFPGPTAIIYDATEKKSKIYQLMIIKEFPNAKFKINQFGSDEVKLYGNNPDIRFEDGGEANAISDTIIELKNTYLNEYSIESCDINKGECLNFADELTDNLTKKGYKNIEILTTDLFFDIATEYAKQDEDEIFYNSLDYNSFKPDNINIPKNTYHAWIYVNGKHYDSDCLEGVLNFYDLPFFNNYKNNNPDIRYAGGGKVKKVKFDIESREGEEDRTTISIKGIGEVVLVETFPEYEFIDDIDEDTLEELGVEEGDIIGKIEHLEIEDKYKGQGYAKLLMNKAIEVAKEKGLMPLYLNASPMGSNGLDINDLTAFYESFGFEVFLEQGNNNLMILK